MNLLNWGAFSTYYKFWSFWLQFDKIIFGQIAIFCCLKLQLILAKFRENLTEKYAWKISKNLKQIDYGTEFYGSFMKEGL